MKLIWMEEQTHTFLNLFKFLFFPRSPHLEITEMKCNPTNKKIVALVFPGRQEKNFEIFTPKFLCIAMASFTPTKGPRWDIETMK